MSYARVIPLDLFNEASLLKCYGQLWLKLENRKHVSFKLTTNTNTGGNSFQILQRPYDGALALGNLRLYIRGQLYILHRPLNSREPWPLYLNHPTDPFLDEIAVFDDHGELSREMLDLLENIHD